MVNLTTNEVEYQAIDEHIAELFIGGRGYGVKRLYENSPTLEPYSEKSVIGLYTGPVTGTAVPLANRLTFVFRSPLTRTIAYANTGGYAAAALKLAGFDAIEITGIGDAPKYLFVKAGEISLLDASNLWGKGAAECIKILKAKHGDVRVLSIGVAGENMVKFANVLNDAGRASGVRHGAGAVLGSKRLKAIVIAMDYTKRVPICDREEFMEVLKRVNTKLRASPMLNRVTGLFSTYGTPLAVDPLNRYEALPYRNYTETHFDGASMLTGKKMSDTILISRLTCNSCSVQCRRETAGVSVYSFRVEGPDYAQISSLGSNCGVGDLESVAYMNHLCYELGLDPIETGNLLAILAQATEKGLVPPDQGLRWGDVDRMVELIRLIPTKNGLLGALADGATRLCEALGDPTLSTAVKGITIQNADPRAEYAWGLLNATENTGASSHIWVYPDLIYSFIELLGSRSLVAHTDPTDYVKLASAVKHKQDLVAVLDSLQICAFSSMAYDLEDYVGALNSVTGWNVDEAELLRVGERIFNLERLYNEANGIVEDTLPSKFLSKPVPSGKNNGKVFPLKELIGNYYTLRGWESGRVGGLKLKELSLP
ncbi:MAG: aldehyde ferredoxin oxidoreductase family protein [Thermoprotei archaeon]